MSKENRPKVGLGVIVRKDGKVLMGKRKNAHGAGDWCFPGGHLEFRESWEDCARRECLEETGVEITNLKCISVTNDIFEEDEKHYITIYMQADWLQGGVELREPEKCERWEWFLWEELPQPLFVPILNLLKQEYHPCSV